MQTSRVPDLDLDQPLRLLLLRFEDRLPAEEAVELADCLERRLYGLALEWLADAVSERGVPVEADERAEMLTLAQRMGVSPYVEEALNQSPEPTYPQHAWPLTASEFPSGGLLGVGTKTRRVDPPEDC